jgi:hypothetical protein
MPVLNAEIKAFVICRLAAFDSPTEVARAVRTKFGIDVSRQQVESHDPTKAIATHGLSAKWRTLFEVERRRFLDDLAPIPLTLAVSAVERRESLLRRNQRWPARLPTCRTAHVSATS